MTADQGPYPAEYPVHFAVEYPDRPLNRLTSFFRICHDHPDPDRARHHYRREPRSRPEATPGMIHAPGIMIHGGVDMGVATGGLLFLAPLLMILFRQRYPRWWFDWNLELQRFGNRIGTYLALMNDNYPSTDDHQWVELDYAGTDAAADLDRWLPLVKWLLAIPHYIVLFFLDIAGVLRTDRDLVRHRVHRPLPARHLQLRRRRFPLAQPRHRLRVHPGHRPGPALQAGTITQARHGVKGGRHRGAVDLFLIRQAEGIRGHLSPMPSWPYCPRASVAVRQPPSRLPRSQARSPVPASTGAQAEP